MGLDPYRNLSDDEWRVKVAFDLGGVEQVSPQRFTLDGEDVTNQVCSIIMKRREAEMQDAASNVLTEFDKVLQTTYGIVVKHDAQKPWVYTADIEVERTPTFFERFKRWLRRSMRGFNGSIPSI